MTAGHRWPWPTAIPSWSATPRRAWPPPAPAVTSPLAATAGWGPSPRTHPPRGRARPTAVGAWQRAAGTWARITPPTADADAHDVAISGDGRLAAYVSAASNIVTGVNGVTRHVFVTMLSTSATELASVTPGGQPANGDS